MDSLFKIYGLPEIIRSDNGLTFANMQSLLGLTKLSVWWLSLGINLDRINPDSPYQNGAHERMHLDMKSLNHYINLLPIIMIPILWSLNIPVLIRTGL